MDDKFKLDKLNIYMICVTSVIFIILVVTIFKFVNSNKNTESKLPVLETTAGNTSTKYATTTTSEIITTTTVSTKIINPGNLNSPYYNVDINGVLNDSIYSKKDLDNDTATKVVEGLVKYANALLDTSDYSIFNTEYVNTVVKDGESDKIIVDDHTYIELYNINEYIAKGFCNTSYSFLNGYKNSNTNSFIINNDKVYRLLTSENNTSEINYISINKYDEYSIKASVSLKTKSGYKLFNINLEYDNSWKIKDYTYNM